MRRIFLAVTVLAAAGNALVAEQKLLPQSQVAHAIEAENCDVPPLDAFEKQSVTDLDSKHKLVELGCLRAAYNFTSIFFIVADGDVSSARRVKFNIWDGRKFTSTTMLTNASYDSKDRVLRSFDKGRGIGDCGSVSEWSWEGETFMLKAHWRQDRCDGKPFDFSSDKSKWRIFPLR